jgi:hypothetical protein
MGCSAQFEREFPSHSFATFRGTEVDQNSPVGDSVDLGCGKTWVESAKVGNVVIEEAWVDPFEPSSGHTSQALAPQAGATDNVA